MRSVTSLKAVRTNRAAYVLACGLFAQPLARTARLTVDQIVDEGHLALQFGTKPVRLPRPSTISSCSCANAATATCGAVCYGMPGSGPGS